MQRQRIDRCVHRHRLDAEGGGRTRDPDRDFAAIGDQHPFEHASFPRLRHRQVRRTCDRLRQWGIL
jgi:hypothetical protein